jgi:hypothetical protein
MPAAHAGAAKKYAYLDHDPPHLVQVPPVINTWYQLYHDYDVRQLLMSALYRDDEETGATIEVRWTCDGNIYVSSVDADDQIQYYIYKTKYNSVEIQPLNDDFGPGGYKGLYRDKRAQDFKVEVRVTTAVGTNARLEAWALYETLEVT